MEKLERFGFEICGCDVGEIGHKKKPHPLGRGSKLGIVF
jgi:hypothetical protein